MSSHRGYDLFGLARTEARCLAHLVEPGTSVEAVRDLIRIPPEMEMQLRHDPEVAAIIAWRQEVLPEFDRLLQEKGALIRCRLVS
jgi:hypothetical protein